MFNKLTLSLLSGLVVFDASAQTLTNVQTNPQSSGYAQDGRGTVTRSDSGLCWRTGYWLPTDAVTGCDGELTSPVARPTAPDLLPSTARNPGAPPLALTTPANRCDFTIVLPGDLSFSFGRSQLTVNAGNRLARDYRERIARCSHLESISVTGHSDRIGSDGVNRYLSEQRAKSVAARLGIVANSTDIRISGVGSGQPITSCPANLTKTKLIACLADDRRATVMVRGEAR